MASPLCSFTSLEIFVEGHVLLHGLRLRVGVSGFRHLAGDVRVGAHECRDMLVEGEALRLVCLELLGVAGVFR